MLHQRRILAFVLQLPLLALGATALAQEDPEEADDAECACDATPLACDASCDCDLECGFDWAADPCADPAAGCEPEVELTEEELDAIESAPDPEPDPWDPPTDPWEAYRPGQLECPELADAIDGRCVDATDPETFNSSSVSEEPLGGEADAGGCSVGGRGSLPSLLAALALLAALLACRRHLRGHHVALLVVIALACQDAPTADPGRTWDVAIDEGPPFAAYEGFLDVHQADLAAGSGSAFVPAFHAEITVATHLEPFPSFSLARAALDDAVSVRRVAAAAGCGDRLVTGRSAGEGELIGYAATAPGDARAPLVELSPPGGCGLVYEADPDAVADLEAEGYTATATIGYVWPPGWGAPAEDEEPSGLAFATACGAVNGSSRLFLFGADLGDEITRVAAHCPGEIVVGLRDEDHPPEAYWNETWRTAGIRTGFWVGHDGKKIKALLETKGVEKTAAYLRAKLKTGPDDTTHYDYIIIHRIDSADAWQDGSATSRKFRQLLTRLPKRKVIAYVSNALTRDAGGDTLMSARKKVFRALHKRGRAIALKIGLKTERVLDDPGLAARTFRQGARRLHKAVAGLGVKSINRRAITVMTLSQQYHLSGERKDHTGLQRQTRALKLGGGKLGQQRGIGWSYGSAAKLAPASNAYTRSELIGWIVSFARCYSGGTHCGGALDPEPPSDMAARCNGGPYTAYRGDVHDHTAYSDGEKTPGDAFPYGRDEGKLDFLIITDHRGKLTSNELGKCWDAADRAQRAGTFVAACGYEVNDGGHQHANFLFAPRLYPTPTSLGMVYETLVSCEECVGQINHPASDRFEWVKFRYHAKKDPWVELIEFNGGSFEESLPKYLTALDKGWHVGPSWNSDTHAANWGTGTGRRTGLWLAELTRDELRTGMRENRSFATADKNASLRIEADGCWLGSVLKNKSSATIEIEARDPDDGYDQIWLLGPGGRTIGDRHDCGGDGHCTASFPITVTGKTYVIGVAHQRDGSDLVTAPIWISP